MLKTIILLILGIQVSIGFAQETQTGTLLSDYVEPESDFHILKGELKNGAQTLQQIENALLKWDYKLLKPFINKELRKEVKSFFNSYDDSIKKYEWEKETHFGPVNTAIAGGNLGLTIQGNWSSFYSKNSATKSIRIEYNYCVKDSSLEIYELYLKYDKYKLNSCIRSVYELTKLATELRQLNLKKKTEEINNTLNKIEQLESKLSKLSFFNLSEFKSQISRKYGNLSWYLIFEKSFEKAIIAADKGLAFDKNQTWIYTNLALSNLLAGNKEKAIEIYITYKTRKTNNNESFRHLFKADLKEVKDANLIDISLYNEILNYLND